MNSSKQRVHLIDGLRGVSLSGIILANMLIFQYGMYGESDPQLFGIGGTDLVLRSLLFIFVVGSFMPVFAFMFGFGMVKLSESLKGRGLRPKSHLARRFLLLLVLGLLHSFLLWEGDILAFYGFTGFFLLLFLNRKPKTLLIWSVLLLSVMGILGIIPQDPEDPLPGHRRIRKTTYEKALIFMVQEAMERLCISATTPTRCRMRRATLWHMQLFWPHC